MKASLFLATALLAASFAHAQLSPSPLPGAPLPFLPLQQRLQDGLWARADAGKPIDLFDRQGGGEGGADLKSPALAAFYSLLLPGMGELYTNRYAIGKYFTIAEGGLIVTLIGFDRYANWLQDDARRYADQHAQASTEGKDDRFVKALGNFNSVDTYNAEMLRSRSPEDTYDPSFNSSYYWNWDSPVNREHYRDIRVSSAERFNDTRFIAAAIAVNHLVSAINAARLAISHNKSIQQGSGIDIHADLIGGLAKPEGVRITFSRSF